ncbi:AAA domain-containing protein [Enemella dayhoffiae]|uniref:AAA domain-containing protein n=1 Tax=Enemella dayhoffiae TaxID=2016507 RepID=UPI001595912C|nr:AAA domain-containing protein [Enemella dayhoffiae]
MAESDVNRVVGMFRYVAALERFRSSPVREISAYAAAPDGQVVALGDSLTATDDPSVPLLQLSPDADPDSRYARLFTASLNHQARPEDLELLLGLGRVRRADAPSIDRAAVVLPARIEVDADSARLALHLDGAPIPELSSFLEPEQWPAGLPDWERRIRAHRGGLNSLGPLVAEVSEQPEPVLILRRRSHLPMVAMLERVADRLEADGTVPPGLRPLLDPDQVPPAPAREGGAFVDVAGDLFGPLPLNAAQRRVVQRVDEQAQVVVQGPPGTGKTHAIAALLSHLLAQGRRVLVTAPTDRALAQLRDQLPDSLRPLAVSVLGTAEAELDELTEAVRRLADEAAHDDPDARADRIQRLRADLDRLAGERSGCLDALVAARAAETVPVPESGRPGTLAEVVAWHREHTERFGWSREFFDPQHHWSPVGGAELLRFRRETRGAGAPSSATEALRHRHEAAVRRAERHRTPGVERWLPGLRAMAPVQRKDFARTLTDLRGRIAGLRQATSGWTGPAVAEVLDGESGPWRSRAATLREVVGRAERSAEALGRTSQVTVQGSDDGLIALVQALRGYAADHTVRLGGDGRPRGGLLAPRAVRAAVPVFERVRVDGEVPTRPRQLEQVLAHLELTRLLELADQQWGEWAPSAEGDWRTRLDRHRIERDRLIDLVRIADELSGITDYAAANGWPPPNWSGFAAGQEMLDTLAAIPDLDHAHATARELARGEQDQDRGRSRLAADIADWHPRLAAALTAEDSDDATWLPRLRDFDAAWAWARTDHWLTERQRADRRADTEQVRERLDVLDRAIVETVARLAGEQAWQHAVARLTPSARAALTAYAQQVRQLGRGTGRHAAQLRREIRELLATARGAVPAWIMPLYRVAEQVEVQPDSFDVVLIDEASQAGLEGITLQYLAPRVVVVGDDKQVSPAGVGRDRDQLQTLAQKHLGEDPLAQLWTNPMRSYFDEATLRFGTRHVLTEHRRSVPEIIDFSNKIAYAPEGVRLQPVRQFGPLRPFRTIKVDDATLTRGNVNAAEAAAVVAEVERIVADPAYEGMSLGVVSLLGQEQSRTIAAELQQRLPAEVWAAQRLQVGEPPAFQGSERDVMVVSLVAAPTGRLVAQTREVAVQRYNVAISRARDQVVLVHSVELVDLPNPEDLRRQLLQHAFEVEAAAGAGSGVPVAGQLSEPVGDQVLVPPFTSLLQQRVADALLEQGYRVTAAEPVQGLRLDLVVHGTRGRVAVECESAQWAGAEAYRRQLSGQRDLARGGWRFVRIRESAWAADPRAALEPLWDVLGAAAIEPVAAPRESASRAAELEPYRVFTGPVPATADLSQVLTDLVGVEGPVVGRRLAQAYAGAAAGADGPRLDAELTRRLGEAVTAAMAAERLIADDPLGSADWLERVYRLPGQPEARARRLGPRRLCLVPLSEAALLLDLVSVRRPQAAEDERFTAVLELWGLPRHLGAEVRRYLRLADRLG